MKSKVCINCTFYTAYYKRWSTHYGQLNHGFCSKHHKPQTQYKICEDYKSNEQKEKTREERLFAFLEQTLNSIIEIAQVLKDRENQKKNQ